MSTGWDFFVTGLNVAIEENGTVKMVTRWKIASHLAGIVLVGAVYRESQNKVTRWEVNNAETRIPDFASVVPAGVTVSDPSDVTASESETVKSSQKWVWYPFGLTASLGVAMVSYAFAHALANRESASGLVKES